MTRLILIPTAQTDWQAQGRLVGDADLPLNEVGHRQAIADGQALSTTTPTLIRSGPEQATKQTASFIAHELHLRSRPVKELRELDLGHWEGLTVEDFSERFPKVYRQWRDDPQSIEPPEGETIFEAAARLRAGVERLTKRHAEDVLAMVVGPFAVAILRCELEDHSYEHFWEYVESDERQHEVNMQAAGGEGSPARPEAGGQPPG
jgi:broad specificity phosphatase PhoE